MIAEIHLLNTYRTLPPLLAILDAGDEVGKKTEIYGLWSVHSG